MQNFHCTEIIWDLIHYYLQQMTLRLLLETQLPADQWKTNISFQQMFLVVYCMMRQSMLRSQPECCFRAM